MKYVSIICNIVFTVEELKDWKKFRSSRVGGKKGEHFGQDVSYVKRYLASCDYKRLGMAVVTQASVASNEEEISCVWERWTVIRVLAALKDFFRWCVSAQHMEALKAEGILIVIGGLATTVNKEKQQRVMERNLQDEETLLDVAVILVN
ncbi:hypothetical protein DPMN_135209 [Dreissena polymorpha]|uniref:Uncharacterized protein n=1 Tax=Dreissena polymorpha TaxID=45954 RepID=A0A9D4FYR8_DREPO|nr:hypothetical protein DPMN_135209 [Dreissena polymorpha]